MRLIGQLADETAARTFGDYLLVQGIENQIEDQKKDGWAVWINDEDKIEQAAALLTSFRGNPSDPKYRSQGSRAAELRAREDAEAEAYRKKVRDRRQLFRPLGGYHFGPLTFALIAFSGVVAFLSNAGNNEQALMPFFITKFTVALDSIRWQPGLVDVRHGEVWRLVTPIFIHFGILHLLFNMWWLMDLGSMIEGRQTTWHLLGLVLGIAIVSNLTQYFYSGPMFGGMSGVVYGLLGYIWIRGKFDPASGLFLHPTTVMVIMIYFFVCFTPLVPHVANGAHAAGLVVGIIWGYLSSLRYR